MGNLPKYMCYANAKRNFFGLFSVGFITVKNILGKQFRATLVDLHLRTKADYIIYARWIFIYARFFRQNPRSDWLC